MSRCAFPSISLSLAIPGLPALPALPTLPGLPGVALPGVPSLSLHATLPSLPALPAPPTLPSLPGVALPGVPSLSLSLALPGLPALPSLPALPLPLPMPSCPLDLAMPLGSSPLGSSPLGFDPAVAVDGPAKPGSFVAAFFDPKIQDYPLDANGRVFSIHPVDQKVALAMSMVRGTLASVPTQGNRLRLLPRANDTDRAAQARAAVREALQDMVDAHEAELIDIRVDSIARGQLNVQVLYRNLKLPGSAPKTALCPSPYLPATNAATTTAATTSLGFLWLT